MRNADEITISELAERCGIPESTVRRYCKLFARQLKPKRYGRTTKYPVEAVEAIKDINQWFSEGMTAQEISTMLHGAVVEVEPSHNSVATIDSMAVMAQINGLWERYHNDTTMLIEALRDSTEANKRLSEQMDEIKLKLAEKEIKKSWWKKILMQK